MKENNVDLSKGDISLDTIKLMYEQAFKTSSEGIEVRKLHGGVESVVYLIIDNSEKKVLKLAPLDFNKTISVDKNTFWWEIKMLSFMEKINFPSPRVLYYDNHLEICSVPYFFMSYIKGENYNDVKSTLSKSEIKSIEFQIGVLSKKISNCISQNFFLPSFPNKKFTNNLEFVSFLFELLFLDAKYCDLNLLEIKEKIYQILAKYRESLNNITKLCLNHTDIWDGNILIDRGKITGIVDFSDLYFCDELMTFYFHTIDGIISEDFLNGYGKKHLTYDEKIRIQIYRIYVLLKMIVECKLKNYGKFDWMYDSISTNLALLLKKER